MPRVYSIARVIAALACCALLQAEPNAPEPKASSQEGLASRIFVGIGTGLALQQDIYSTTSAKTTYPALSVSARGGYQYRFFTPLIVRLYLDYTMSVRPTGLESITTSSFLINSDVVSYFYTLGTARFGVFAGVGLGYGTYGREVQEDPSALDSVLAKGFSALINGGISVLFANAHRLELGVRYPITTLELAPTKHYQDIHLLCMYDYLF